MKFSWCHDISQVPSDRWQALVTDRTSPFLEYDWLYCLEASGSAKPNTGWMPSHLLVEIDGQLVAAAPMYLKGHSYGEFVFDQEWARVAQQLGEEYYPKLLGMAPFTPCTGYRFLIHPDYDEADLLPAMFEEIDRFCDRQDISVCSFLYADPDWHSTLDESGFIPRITHNYQWHNPGYADYPDFLQQFNANQRRNIKRERKAMQKAEVDIKFYAGDDLTPKHFQQMYRFYSNTCLQFWDSSKYLNRRFFNMLAERCRDRILLVAGERDGETVGMSFCVYKGDRLFGRYWGAEEDIKFLHFSLCYYEPIAWAIDNKIANFDPGAGGQHKIRRGFPATPNHSYHRIYRPRLRKLLVPHLLKVNPLMLKELERVNQEAVPFKSDVLPSLTSLTEG
ncbi:MAG: GNAT family N-acetyltransferase [Cyanobacteria bacterium P01_E01_bin.34]